MAARSVRFDFLMGRNTVSAGAKKVAHDLDDLEDHAEKSGRGAGKRFREGFGDGGNDRGGLFKKLITPNPELFASLRAPLAKALSTPVGLAVAASLTQALALALPAGIALGAGAGLIALGAFALRGSDKLKKHFKAAGTAISESLRQAAQPLKGPFLQAIETISGAILQLQPQFRGLFSSLKPAIKPFVDGMMGFVRQVIPGLQAAMPGINTAFAAMGQRLPGLGKTMGNFLAAITANLPAIERGVGIFFSFAEAIINVGGAFLTLAQKASSTLSTVGGWLSKVKEYTIGLHGGQKDAAKSSEDLANKQGEVAIAAQKAAVRHQELVAKVKEVKQAFYQERAAVSSVIPMFEGYSAKSGITKDKILSNLRQEVGAYKTWAKDAQTLLKRGADPEVVRQLSLKGPEYVHAFVNASEGEMKAMSGMMKARIQAAGTIAKIQGRIMGVEIGKAIQRAIENAFHPRLVVPMPSYGRTPPAARGSRGTNARSFARAAGGPITEPVVGVGMKTGATWTFAERGPEMVVPMNRPPTSRALGGAGGNTYSIAVTVAPGGNPAETGAQIVKLIREHERRSGASWRAS